MNRLLRDIALTFLAGLVIGVLNLKAGPTHISWEAFRAVLDDALRSGLLVPMAAALAPFYPEYGVGSATAKPGPIAGNSGNPAIPVAAEPPDYTKPQI